MNRICLVARFAYTARLAGLVLLAFLEFVPHTAGHDFTLPAFRKERRVAQAQAAALAEGPVDERRGEEVCQLALQLIDDATGKPLPGIVRVTNLESGKAVRLSGLVARDMNWYATAESPVVAVPATKLKIEAVHGLEMELGVVEIDARGQKKLSHVVKLRRFYDSGSRGLRSGNTHVHLMKMTYEEADRYLRVVPKADALDLVYLSYLRRVSDERTYISNEIVANSFAGGDLARLSQTGVLFGNGQEHRHNFGPGGEGYGHVMFLDILRLIQPVSIGPGIMGEGTDGLPLQRGIKQAREEGAAVIWCHNKFGFEDVPNWIAGLVDAQNIFDGGNHGSYEDTFYRYLNMGMQVPFSTGTDWYIYDFSRVYVPLEGELTSKKWLAQLRASRSFITNGPLLELDVNGHKIGDTVSLEKTGTLRVNASGIGRNNFRQLELVHNGKVIHREAAISVSGHFTAKMNFNLEISEPGWLAVRIPAEAGKNEFEKPLYAHTSPIYVEFQGKRIFQPQIAHALTAEIANSIESINRQGKFANEAERESVLRVHRDGMSTLAKWLQENKSTVDRVKK